MRVHSTMSSTSRTWHLWWTITWRMPCLVAVYASTVPSLTVPRVTLLDIAGRCRGSSSSCWRTYWILKSVLWLAWGTTEEWVLSFFIFNFLMMNKNKFLQIKLFPLKVTSTFSFFLFLCYVIWLIKFMQRTETYGRTQIRYSLKFDTLTKLILSCIAIYKKIK